VRSLFRWVFRHRVLALVAVVGMLGGTVAVRGLRSGGDRPAEPPRVAPPPPAVPRPAAVPAPATAPQSSPVPPPVAAPQPAGITEMDTPPLGIPIADVLVVAPGPYPRSALSQEDGSAPTAEFIIKGKMGSMRCHGPESPYFHRTKAEVWFRTMSDAEAAGFRAWRPSGR